MTGIRRFRTKGQVNLSVEAARLQRYGVMVGLERGQSGVKCYLPTDWLWTHLHVIGPTGTGKTRWLTWLFQLLAQQRKSTTIVIDPKGDLFELAWRWVARSSLAARTILFDPGSDRIVGYNPLRPNGLPIETHAKAVREGITAAWGQGADFDHTPQLARCLFYALALARELELTMVEALQVLYPSSPLRKALLPRLRSPHLREALSALDALSERRQEELVASSVARLEPFVADPAIARIFTQQSRALDLGEVTSSPHLVLVNLAKFKPLREADVKLLGRLIVNDIVAHVFQREAADHRVFLLVDEVQDVATRDFCAALDQGRGLGLHVVAAHQHLHQLKDEEKSGYLYHSMMADARTKIIFGGLSVEYDLRVLAEHCFLGQFDPMKVKDEIDSLECEPVESTRKVPTTGRSRSWSAGLSVGSGATRSQGLGRGVVVGKSHQSGTSVGHSVAVSTGHGHMAGGSLGSGEVVLPDGTVAQLASHQGEMSSDSFFETETETNSKSVQESKGEHEATSESLTFGMATTQSITFHGSIGGATTDSTATVPFYEYKKRRVVSSRTFETWDEFVLQRMQELERQPRGAFLVKGSGEPPRFLRAPFVPDPRVLPSQLVRAQERVYARPIYSSQAEVDAEDRARRVRLLDLAKNQPPLTLVSSEHLDEPVIIHGRRRRKTGKS